MKTVSALGMSRMDNPDVKEFGGKDNASRKAYRVRIIKKFMRWANKGGVPPSDTGFDVEEFNAIKRQNSFWWMMFAFGSVSNILFYQAFMTGIYNYRIYELVDMKRVPLPAKLAVSSVFTFGMARILYNDHLYEEDTYKAATRYRHLYDKEYSESYLENEKLGPFGALATPKEEKQ